MSKAYRTFATEADLFAFNEAAKVAMGLPRPGTTEWVQPGSAEGIEGEPLGSLTVGIARFDRPHDLTADLVRADLLTADEIAGLASAYEAWATGTTYEAGDLRAHGGTLWKCVQGHRSQADWRPGTVPALWTHAAPAGVIPAWKAPSGAHDAYNTGDKVTYKGKVYESLINANVWAPDVYPAGWKLIP